MPTERNLDLMKKLKALAERGVGGEKENAARKLAALMKKYNIEEADIEDDVVSDHEFKYKDWFQKKLLNQLFYKVNRERGIFHYKSGEGARSILIFRGTAAEAAQIAVEYDFYCDLWEEEVEFFAECFIQKHQIFPDDVEATNDGMDGETLFRMAAMINGMQDKELLLRLEAGAGGGGASA